MSNYQGRPNKPSKDPAQIGNIEVRAQSWAYFVYRIRDTIQLYNSYITLNSENINL